MASLPFPADMSPTRLALAIGVGASASAAAIVFLLVGNAILAAGFLAAALVVGGVAIAVRLLMPVPESQPRSIDWDFTRAVAQASGDAVAITDRAGRLVCANDAYDRLFAGFPTPPGLLRRGLPAHDRRRRRRRRRLRVLQRVHAHDDARVVMIDVS